MKEKGFTLIELLAVIVILAIIALIAVPIIIDIIEDSKKEALKRSAENYLKAVELAIAKENLKGEFNPNSCIITSGTTKCGDKTLNVTVDGELPESGEIKLSNGIIDKTSETFLIYNDKDTLTYDENNKLTISQEATTKELIAEGAIISETTSGVAVNVDNQLVYYVPEGSNEATVHGYRGNINYNHSMIAIDYSVQTSGDIVIASKVKINDVIYPVTSIADYAFTAVSSFNPKMPAVNLTSVVMQNGITSIGNSAFANCTNLSNVQIPLSVTSIGESAFAACSNLTQININKPTGSIEGAPWGASATVNWAD
ncbi:MAG: leucine-rich repeat domain-containing protein [bacterium]|nr:leucine-rich repeat domain-containing protein [bacterium]